MAWSPSASSTSRTRSCAATRRSFSSGWERRGTLTVAVTNVFASSAARDADGAIYLHSGPEISVASTKTLAAHMVSLGLLALRMATVHGRVSLERRHELVAAFRALPDQVRALVEREKEIAKLAKKYSKF